MTILSVGDGNNWSCLIIKLIIIVIYDFDKHCKFQDTIVKQIVIKCNILNFVGSDLNYVYPNFLQNKILIELRSHKTFPLLIILKIYDI